MKWFEKLEKRVKSWYPPGYEYGKEWALFGVCLGVGFLLSLSFLVRLDSQVDGLYRTVSEGIGISEGVKVLKQGAVAQPYLSLARGSLSGFLMALAYPFASIADHWLYYRRNVRCIYLMKRLPDRCFMAKSCVKSALAELGVWCCTVLLVYFIYYGCYLLRIPKECLPGRL